MKKLQQIKDEYLEKEYGTTDLSSFDHEDVDEIAKRYARECCKASLERAAKNNSGNDIVLFEEITDEENIVMP